LSGATTPERLSPDENRKLNPNDTLRICAEDIHEVTISDNVSQKVPSGTTKELTAWGPCRIGNPETNGT
jgi:hypothetical protein